MRAAWIAAAAVVMGSAAGAATVPDDPFVYMEEANGEKAMAFVNAENARSLPVLQNDPRYKANYAEALKLATAKDRIPAIAFMGDGTVRNFWQDADHVHGLWRAASLESYRSGNPQWRTLIDLDA